MARKGSMRRKMSKRSGRRTGRRMSRRMSRKQSRRMTRKQSRKMRRGKKKVGGAGGADGAAVVRSQNREELEQMLTELHTKLAEIVSFFTDAGLTGEIMDDQTNHLQLAIADVMEKIENLDAVDAVVAQEQARAQEEAVARGYLGEPVATAPSELAVAEAASSRAADEELSQIEAAMEASREASSAEVAERSQIEAAMEASRAASSAEVAQQLLLDEVLAASRRDQGMAAEPEARRRTKMVAEERFTE